MLRSIQSAAQFNRKLRHFRPTKFIDLHTEREQVPARTQPTRVGIQVSIKPTSHYSIDNEIVVPGTASYSDPNWVSLDANPGRYPIALMPGQVQTMAPV